LLVAQFFSERLLTAALSEITRNRSEFAKSLAVVDIKIQKAGGILIQLPQLLS
jgi:hypothetical protein